MHVFAQISDKVLDLIMNPNMLYICLTSCFLSWYSMNNFIYNRNPQPYLLSAGCKIVHLFCLLISIRFGSWLLHWNFYNDPLSSHHTQINWTYSPTLFHFTLTFWRPCHPPFPSSTYMLYIYTTITFHFYIASNSNNFFQKHWTVLPLSYLQIWTREACQSPPAQDWTEEPVQQEHKFFG